MINYEKKIQTTNPNKNKLAVAKPKYGGACCEKHDKYLNKWRRNFIKCLQWNIARPLLYNVEDVFVSNHLIFLFKQQHKILSTQPFWVLGAIIWT